MVGCEWGVCGGWWGVGGELLLECGGDVGVFCACPAGVWGGLGAFWAFLGRLGGVLEACGSVLDCKPKVPNRIKQGLNGGKNKKNEEN